MTDRCKKSRSAELTLCDAAQEAVRLTLIHLLTARNLETRKRRQVLAVRKGKIGAPLTYCPFCRANVDTSPKEPT